MYGVDLSLFQFDYDLTFAAVMLNADRAVYGRYGSRDRKSAGKEVTLAGFKKALQGALELHAEYPANRARLVRKVPPPPRWKTPESLPVLAGKHRKGDVSTWGCIHCHTVREGIVKSSWREDGSIADALLWGYPRPEEVGLTLDPDERATVTRLSHRSPAAAAGFRRGDVIVEFGGQPVISIADVQWVLHQAGESAEIEARVRRAGSTELLTLGLRPGWRRSRPFVTQPRTLSSWFLQMTIPGMTFYDLPPEKRKRLGLKENAIGIEVQSTTQEKSPSSWSRAALRAGVRSGDVIVGVDGKVEGMDASALTAYLFQKKKPGDRITLKIRRGGQTWEAALTLP